MGDEGKPGTATSDGEENPNDTAVESVDSESKAANPDEKSKPADEDYPDPAVETGGPKGLEPTRYGDWERKGIISDF